MKKKLFLVGSLLLLLGLSGISSTFYAADVPPVGCYHNGKLYQIGQTWAEVIDGRLIRYTCNPDGNVVRKDMGPANGN